MERGDQLKQREELLRAFRDNDARKMCGHDEIMVEIDITCRLFGRLGFYTTRSSRIRVQEDDPFKISDLHEMMLDTGTTAADEISEAIGDVLRGGEEEDEDDSNLGED